MTQLDREIRAVFFHIQAVAQEIERGGVKVKVNRAGDGRFSPGSSPSSRYERSSRPAADSIVEYLVKPLRDASTAGLSPEGRKNFLQAMNAVGVGGGIELERISSTAIKDVALLAISSAPAEDIHQEVGKLFDGIGFEVARKSFKKTVASVKGKSLKDAQKAIVEGVKTVGAGLLTVGTDVEASTLLGQGAALLALSAPIVAIAAIQNKQNELAERKLLYGAVLLNTAIRKYGVQNKIFKAGIQNKVDISRQYFETKEQLEQEMVKIQKSFAGD